MRLLIYRSQSYRWCTSLSTLYPIFRIKIFIHSTDYIDVFLFNGVSLLHHNVCKEMIFILHLSCRETRKCTQYLEYLKNYKPRKEGGLSSPFIAFRKHSSGVKSSKSVSTLESPSRYLQKHECENEVAIGRYVASNKRLLADTFFIKNSGSGNRRVYTGS